MVVAHGRRFALGLIVGVLLVVAAPRLEAETSETVPVVVATATGEHLFRAEVAATPAERNRGLMFREHMDQDAGMVFLFDPPQRAAFWMKNTLIPLDMLFLDRAGQIVFIAANTEPLSETSHGPAVPVSAVLEINGGLSERLGIDVGDTVRSPALRR